MGEERQTKDVLNYSTPEVERAGVQPKVPLDAYCVAALAIALLAPIHVAVAGGAAGLAVFGGLRTRQRQVRGVPYAIAAFVLALLWPSLASSLFDGFGYRASRLVSCQANLRTIGQAVAMYESEYPGATGYGLDELMPIMGSPSGIARCTLDHELDASGKPLAGYNYVLLPHLQPYRGLANPAKTVIAFDLHTHTYGSGERERSNVVLLFADGHVEAQTPMSAQQVISRSLMMRPTTQPAGTRPAQ